MNYLKPIFALTSMMALGVAYAADSPTGASPAGAPPGGAGAAPPMMGSQLPVPKPGVYGLNFDAKNYTVKSIEVGGKTVQYRAFENIVYVTHPVDTKYQRMNVYVPESYYEDKTVGRFSAQTAPIFFPNSVGGYMPGDRKSVV